MSVTSMLGISAKPKKEGGDGDGEKSDSLSYIKKICLWVAGSILVGTVSLGFKSFVDHMIKLNSRVVESKDIATASKNEVKVLKAEMQLRFKDFDASEEAFSDFVKTSRLHKASLETRIMFLERAIGLEEYVKWLKKYHAENKDKKITLAETVKKYFTTPKKSSPKQAIKNILKTQSEQKTTPTFNQIHDRYKNPHIKKPLLEKK